MLVIMYSIHMHMNSERIFYLCVVCAGISCPRGARPAVGGGGMTEGEPFGEEAHAFTKERVLQRDVEIKVDNVDKAGSMIGSVDTPLLSNVELIELWL